MATENVNQSGASTAADSAREETAALENNTGPDSAAVEPPAASETNQAAHTDLGAAAAHSSEQPDSSEAATAPLAEQHSDGEPSGAQDFSAMLETYEKESAASRQEGEIVRGIVVGISEQNVLVDIGYKSE